MEEQSLQPEKPVRRKNKSSIKLSRFTQVYLIILAVLLALSACALIYVHRSLKSYEASQPENILQKRLDALREEGKFEEILSLERARGEMGATEEEIAQFKTAFLAGTITLQEDLSAVDAERKTYQILCNGEAVASATLKLEGQETRLLILTLEQWSVEKMEVTGYRFSLTAPAGAIIKNNGQIVRGETADGITVYDIRSLLPMDIQVCDVLGNSVSYDPKTPPTFADYKITVPSNYTIQGQQTVPAELATQAPIEQLQYVAEYCPDVPQLSTYVLTLLGQEPNIKILDGSGNEVDFTIQDRTVTVTDFVGQATMPTDVDIDPLEVAKLWSLFMTQDLTGANNGYATIAAHLIQDSYLQKKAWEWATGIDITFTSSHTLKNPPFQTESISNFIVYSDHCFSCDIVLEKTLVLTRTGEEVLDKINSRFYFVKYDDTDNGQDDPRWVLADYTEIS